MLQEGSRNLGNPAKSRVDDREHLLDRVSLAVPVHSGCGVGCACFPPPGFVMCACVMLIAAGSVSQAR